jgi:hypothetical protein
MTNKDKFMQVFGEEPDTDVCPVGCRTDCPCFSKCKGSGNGRDWWNSEYKRKRKN